MTSKQISVQHPFNRNKTPYYWRDIDNGYFGIDTSCGSYGAVLHDGKWFPACSQDNGFVDTCDESYGTPEEAINRSHNYFT
jgi:hypothetical protein